MKKADFMEKLGHIISRVDFGGDMSGLGYDKAAEFVWAELTKLGIKPPPVSEEMRQCIMHVYYAGYTFNQWDEDLEKDQQVMETKKRREAADKVTPAESVALIQEHAEGRRKRAEGRRKK